MPWFASWGQVLQLILTGVALCFTVRTAFLSMSMNNFFSAGAMVFYLLVALVLVSLWLAVTAMRRPKAASPASFPIPASEGKQSAELEQRSFVKDAVKILEFVEWASKGNTQRPVKIVSLQEDYACAEMIVKALQRAGYTPMINEQDASCIFPARTTHHAVILRAFPHFQDRSMSNLSTAFSRIGIQPEIKDLPDSENFPYVQVEIGGGP